MDELFRIAPKENDPGAYECPSCAYVTSVLVRPEDRRSRGHALRDHEGLQGTLPYHVYRTVPVPA